MKKDSKPYHGTAVFLRFTPAHFLCKKGYGPFLVPWGEGGRFFL